MKILELFRLGGSSLERKNANNYGIFLHNSKEVGVELGFFFFFFLVGHNLLYLNLLWFFIPKVMRFYFKNISKVLP